MKQRTCGSKRAGKVESYCASKFVIHCLQGTIMNKNISMLSGAVFLSANLLCSGLAFAESDEERLARLSNNAEFFTLVKRAAPEYPKRAQRMGKEGFVVIEYTIDTEGQVVEPKVIDADPPEMFDDAAIAAIKKWKYRAEFNGAEPDMAMARTRMRFALE